MAYPNREIGQSQSEAYILLFLLRNKRFCHFCFEHFSFSQRDYGN